jgi:hypothetical protein
MGEDTGREITVRTIAAAVAAGAGLASPDLGALATFLTPTAELVLDRLLGVIGLRRKRHVAETLAAAAEERSESIEELLEAALANDGNQELFMRAATVAQDAALKEKRVALGRALAAGLNGDEAAINDELLFIRAIADLDAPHIQLLRVMSEPRSGTGQMAGHALVDGWTRDNLAPLVPSLVQHVPSLLTTLEQHGFVEWQNEGTWAGLTERSYRVTDAGRACLDRLTLEPDAEPQGEDDGSDQPTS